MWNNDASIFLIFFLSHFFPVTHTASNSDVTCSRNNDSIARTRWCHFCYWSCRGRKWNAGHRTRYIVKPSFSAYRLPPTDYVEFRERGSRRWANANAFADSVHRWNTPYSILGSSRGEGNSRNFIASLTAERRVKMRRLDPRGRLRERTLARRSFSALCLPTLQSRPRATNARRVRAIHHALLPIRS